jgi:predicted pyridoxine 5'-phosphate oxidase superfamily flavin-nucleotide-binding protein
MKALFVLQKKELSRIGNNPTVNIRFIVNDNFFKKDRATVQTYKKAAYILLSLV